VSEDDELLARQAELVELLDAGESYEDTLRRIARMARATIPGCTSASVTLWREGTPYTVVSTDDVALEIDRAQYETREGPCLDASRDGETYVIADMETETRWPAHTPLAVRHGVRASLSAPLVVRHSPVGALNMYSTELGAFAGSVELGTQFAAQAAVAIANVAVYHASRVLTGQVGEALPARDVVEQAKGVLVADTGRTPEEAFELLREESRRDDVELGEVARRIVEGRAGSAGSA
jgi:GAF domain-containing protein